MNINRCLVLSSRIACRGRKNYSQTENGVMNKIPVDSIWGRVRIKPKGRSSVSGTGTILVEWVWGEEKLSVILECLNSLIVCVGELMLQGPPTSW